MAALLTVSDFRQRLGRIDLSGISIPFIVLLILSMLVLPLPPILLDLLFTLNIMIGLIIIMVAINTTKPLEFSSFPSILLLATLLRLGLNVASTRIVLVNGHEGTDAAGKVIEAFGEFVIAGNYLVGFIIFAILMIINFIVVTKGAGRVSEVIARFTLDGLPGKQMAIDADLNAGVITQEEAKQRREEVSQESDFFGSMDGASKFVRGDAVAGILILAINIIGGLAVGMLQHDLSLSEASTIYVLLTIGDGLVAQIPSLLLSFATAILVTRVTTAESMVEQAGSQLSQPGAIFLSAGVLAILGLVPGMPHFIFLSLAGAAAGLGYYLQRQSKEPKPLNLIDRPADDGKPKALEELGWDDIEQVDLIGLNIGYGLVSLANTESGGQLLPRIKGIRKKLSAELGFLIQPIRIRDDLDLSPDAYTIVINGVIRGRGEVRVGRELAINPGQVSDMVAGEPTKDPAFGLDAVWIEASQRDYARALGYTVVDSATAIATHLNTLLRDCSAELLSHDETQQLLDKVASRSPKLVDDLIPSKLSLSVLTRVLQNLLTDSVPVRDMRTILETLSTKSAQTQDPDELTALVRPRLGRMIVQNLVDQSSNLPVITLDAALEQMLHTLMQQSGGARNMVLEPTLAESLLTALSDNVREAENQGINAVLVVSPPLRAWMALFVRHRINGLTVLSYEEIPDDQAIRVVASIDGNVQQ
jgi:flagellar biosynthesis protein FlhA